MLLLGSPVWEWVLVVIAFLIVYTCGRILFARPYDRDKTLRDRLLLDKEE